MISSRTIIAVCLAASVCAAQTFNIRGTVKDSGGVGISGATVKLAKAGLSATTGADGSFALVGTTGIRTARGGRTVAASPVRVSNGTIALTLSDNAPVKVSIHDIGGRQLYTVEATYGPGTHAVRVPVHYDGILLYRVTIGGEAYSFQSSPLGISPAGLAGASGGSSSLAKEAEASAGIADVITVVKEGQLNYRDSIRTSDTSGIVVKMLPNAGDVTDADGNVYQSVKIGNQVWTVENLRTTKYKDGTPIPLVTDGTAWANLSTPAYCFYVNSTVFAEQKKWGALYNWYAVNTGKLAPSGWHVPTDAEWTALENYLIANGYNWDGTRTGNKIAKSMAAKTDWYPDTAAGTIGKDPGKNNASGFSALPGGFRSRSIDGYFYNLGLDGCWWSATENDASFAYYRSLSYGDEHLRRDYNHKQDGFSVRLLRD